MQNARHLRKDQHCAPVRRRLDVERHDLHSAPVEIFGTGSCASRAWQGGAVTVYFVTTSNYNDPAFWSAISESSAGHTLDFSALPSGWSVDYSAASTVLRLFDGSVWHTVGEAGDPATDYTFGAGTQFSYFSGLTGSDSGDSILGGDGDDTILTGLGNDVADGGAGNDFIDARTSAVTSDTLTGGTGNDTIYAGNGTNVVDAGDGDDFVQTGNGFDLILGGTGNDTLLGGATSDTIYGGSGDDSIRGEGGSAANDVLYGEDGADTIRFDEGNDTVDGGADGDLIYASATTGNAVIIGGETVTTGTDFDTLDLSALSASVTVDWTGSEAGTVVSGADTITFSEIEQIVLTNNADNVDASLETVAINLDGAGGDDSLTGGSGSDTLDGGSGNDAISADLGNDTVYGGDGDDSIWGEEGDDSIEAGTGNDMVLGGQGNDTLLGGDGSDQLWAGSTGTDLLYGDGADDDLLLGSGNDSAWGGDGDDDFYHYTSEGVGDTITVWGGEGDEGGADLTNGSSGDRLVLSFNGAAVTDNFTVTFNGDEQGTVTGGATDWQFYEIERILVGTGDDTIDASADNAGLQLRGNGGADSIIGGSGSDTILGENGDDIITGGAGDDSLTGGNDADTFVIEDGFGNDTILGGGGVSTGTDFDTLDLSATTTPLTITISGSGAGTISDGTSTATFSDIERLILSANAEVVDATLDTGGIEIVALGGNDNVIGGSGADTLDGGPGNNTIDGGAGADSIVTSSGADSLSGGAGNDTINAGSGNDSIDGGLGDDSLVGGLGRDTLRGGDGNDTLTNDQGNDLLDGGAGNDTIYGGNGTDTLIGGAGDDWLEAIDDFNSNYFWIDNADGNDTITGFNGGGGSPDIVQFFATTSSDGVTVTYTTGETGSYAFNGAAGTAIGTFFDIEGVHGTLNNDVFDASGALTGSISVYTNGGDNLVTGSAFYDNINLQGGAETVFGGDGDDYIETTGTGTGDDSIDGGAGNDSIHLYDSGTRVTIDGGAGDDDVWNSDSDITYVLNDGFGTDSIRASVSEGDVSGGDEIDGSALSNGVSVSFSTDRSGTLIDGVASVTFDEMERFILTAQADTYDGTGSVRAHEVAAGAGNDTLTGGSGSDTLRGGDGADSVAGGAGDDYIEGGAGDDSLTTGDGQDTVYGGDGNDTIRNAAGDDLLVGGAGDDSIIATDGNDTLLGEDGNDTLEGGVDDDSLVGGTGNDVFVYTAGDGNDIIADFNTGNTGTLDDGDDTNNDFIDLSAFYDSIWELHGDQADDGILNQSNTLSSTGNTVDYSDNIAMGGSITFTGASADRSYFTNENTGVVCFTKGAMIATPHGAVPIETLRPGDLVLTRDNGPQPLVWIGSRHLGHRKLASVQQLKPILIAPELTGADAPLLVSPQHGVLLKFDGEEQLVRAKHLAQTRGGQARVAKGCRSVTYYHLLFEAHQIVFANGAPSQSFYPGPQAIRALQAPALNELQGLFPDLVAHRETASYGNTARTFLPRAHLPDSVAAFACP